MIEKVMAETDLEQADPFVRVEPERLEGDGVHVGLLDAEEGRNISRIGLELVQRVAVDRHLAMNRTEAFSWDQSQN